MQENDIEATSTSINFADNLIEVNPKFSQLQQITAHIPRARFDEMTAKMNEKGSLYKAEDHPFMPPKTTSPITLESLASNRVVHEKNNFLMSLTTSSRMRQNRQMLSVKKFQ